MAPVIAITTFFPFVEAQKRAGRTSCAPNTVVAMLST
jgi:hypothetical protein